jgi:uncharacterized membrane protein YkoI
MTRLVLTAIASVLLLASAGGEANAARDGRPNRDQDIAREALQRGEVMPIARILTLVAQYMPGDIIEIELDTQRGRLTYEIRVLTPAGRVGELTLDARTGELISLEN